MIIFELETLFQESLKEGLNLFCGSGFPVLTKDKNDKYLPNGSQLAEELITSFKLPKGLQLDQISTILESTQKQKFIQFLKNRFFVNFFDERYLIINQLNLNSIFTTNIDNLFFDIFSKSPNKYLNDITLNGPAYKDKTAVNYVPLHGNILNDERKMIFSSIDIASTYANDQNVWHYLRYQVSICPSFFWGYSLSDSSVIQALYSNLDKGKQHKPKWILLRSDDEASKAYFKSLGFNIVIGETLELLEWLKQKIGISALKINESLINDAEVVFSNEKIPKNDSNLPVRPIRYFYSGQSPYWSDIYSHRIPKLSHFEKLLDIILSNQNTIVIGIPASGKTTLMMQVAASMEFSGHKLICSDVQLEKAKLISSHLLSDSAIIFIDNFTDIIDTYQHFCSFPNIKIVAFDRQHNFEIISHKIDQNNSCIYDCTALTDSDMQLIFNKMPEEIRNQRLKSDLQRQISNDLSENIKPSIFDFINLNVNKPTINIRYVKVLNELNIKNPLALELLVMTCYVSFCRTPLSYDMVKFYFTDDTTNYAEIYRLINDLGELLQEFNGEFDDNSQDYYIPRSSIIAEAILKQVQPEIFNKVFAKFHKHIPTLAICRFHIFRTRGYDADFVRKAFPRWEDGEDFYFDMREKDPSPFILQQCALYLLSKKQFSNAFEWIDEALSISPKYYFSIQNTHAIILFQANINSSDKHEQVYLLDQSMDILKKCYKADKRKLYHVLSFAKQSIQYFTVFGDEKAREYLRDALTWLKEEQKGNSWNWEIKRYLREIEQLV